VPVGDRAPRRTDGEIVPQPRRLRGARTDGNVAVQRDDMPVAKVIAVETESRGACACAEVVEVGRGRGRAVVLVVARNRTRASLVTSPGRVIAGAVVLRRS